MWKKIKNFLSGVPKFFEGKKRRFAIIGSGITTIGGLTANVPLLIVGTVITSLFAGLDAKGNKEKYKQLLKKPE